ncbi:Chloroperoxidase [Lophiotrema nucula]|uniref:Chloroperoxidase n=1 Tax=Lophiotrema nucula TaxID=690887 RepID=A0A6A5YNX7_9PLEO|nr:Chloroperoxidase [Lophiotrema nucula]
MRFLICTTFAAIVSASPGLNHGLSKGQWHPPVAGDVRSPCPGLNVLANHGILPRDGKNYDHDMILEALPSTYNIDEKLATGLFQQGLRTTVRSGATTFSLDDLIRHDIVEADASLSRADAWIGDDFTFNLTIWDQTRSFWKNPIITVEDLAHSVEARWRTSKATNPWFSLLGERIPMVSGGAALFTSVLGNSTAGTLRKDFINEWIVEERLPIRLGWKKNKTPVSPDTVSSLSQRIFAKTDLAGEINGTMTRALLVGHGGMAL